MAIRFAYGSYVSTSCAVRPTGRTIVPRMINDFAVSYIWTLQLEVEITQANTYNIVAESIALREAIAVQGLSGGIQFNDGTGWLNTEHWLNAFGAIGGVQITSFGLSDSPLQLASEQKGTITMTAEYANLNEARTLLLWDEQVEISGEGGAQTELVEQATALGFYQQTQLYTPVTVVQSGRMIGRNAFPNAPPFLIVTADARQVRQTRDRRSYTRKGATIIEYIRDYSFTYHLAAHPGSLVPGTL